MRRDVVRRGAPLIAKDLVVDAPAIDLRQMGDWIGVAVIVAGVLRQGAPGEVVMAKIVCEAPSLGKAPKLH